MHRIAHAFYFVKRQGIALALGIVVFLGLLRIDYRKLRGGFISDEALKVSVGMVFFFTQS